MPFSPPHNRSFFFIIFTAFFLVPALDQAQASELEIFEGIPPELDGLISLGEWDDALKIEGTRPIQAIYFKHDPVNLYVAVQAKGAIDEFFLGFDTNENGVAFDAGDDIKRCLDGVCEDWYYIDDYLFALDEQQDVEGIGFYDEGTDTHIYELVMPKESADPEGADPAIGAELFIIVSPGIVIEDEEYLMPPLGIKTKPATTTPPVTEPGEPTTRLPPTLPTEPTTGIPWWGWLAGVGALALGASVWLYTSRRKRQPPKITPHRVPVELPPERPPEVGVEYGEEPKTAKKAPKLKIRLSEGLKFARPGRIKKSEPKLRIHVLGKTRETLPIKFLLRTRAPYKGRRTARFPRIRFSSPFFKDKIWTPKRPKGPVVPLRPPLRVKTSPPPMVHAEYAEKESRLLSLDFKIREMESKLKAAGLLRQQLESVGNEIKQLKDKIKDAGVKAQKAKLELDRLSKPSGEIEKGALESVKKDRQQKHEKWSAKKKEYEKKKKGLEARERGYKKRLSGLFPKSKDPVKEISKVETKLKNLKEQRKRLETEIGEEYKKRKKARKEW